ncbi:MAG: Hint domain-containing protein [Pseudomonadota bacterium]
MTKIFSRPAFAVLAPPSPRFLPGTRLATPSGPRNVEVLVEGDLLSTRDGAVPIRRIGVTAVPRAETTSRRDVWPVRVPVGSLGNPVPLRLRADQRVVLAGDQVLEHCGVARASVALSDLVGLRGLMYERPLADLRWFGLALDASALLRVEGAVCELADGPGDSGPDREAARAAFQAMNAVGEPKLVAF